MPPSPPERSSDPPKGSPKREPLSKRIRKGALGKTLPHLNPEVTKWLDDSLAPIEDGLSDAAKEWNPIHPQTSFQASLLLAAVVVGLVATSYAWIMDRAQELFHGQFEQHPYLAAAAVPLLFVASVWIVRRFAPDSRGSGIPQVLRSIDQAQVKRFESLDGPLVSVKTAFWKIVSSTVGMLGGASIGREGPTVQVAASLFAFTARYSRRWFGSIDPQSYLIAGAAAGISAAFNTPLAGITFALEEIAQTTFAQFKRTVMLAVVVGGITALALGGNYLYFGHPVLEEPGYGIYPVALLLGLLGGLFGGLFAHILAHARIGFLPTSWYKRALVCGILCAGFMILSEGDTAGSGYQVTKEFMESSDASLPLLHFPMKFLSTVFSYLSGMAGGVFSPCLSIGAGMGSTAAVLFDFSDPKACALIGMVAFFSGVVQAPLTAVIIIMEMTDQSLLIIPFLIAAFAAQGIGRLLMPVPLYRQLAMTGFPDQPEKTPPPQPEPPPEGEKPGPQP